MLENARILVTGGAQGIGEAIVAAFRAREARVALLDIQEKGEETARRLGAIFVQGDLSDTEDRARAFGDAVDALGGLDVLVNDAAIAVEGSILDVDLADWRRVLEVNLTAPMHLSALAAQRMRDGGAIVHVASVQGLQAEQENAAYCASKGGLVNLTRSMALDLAPRNIRVNAVAPGAVDTPALQEALSAYQDPEEARRDFGDLHALRRIARAEEVAEAVVWLASKRASFVTGAVLAVDGGMTASFMMAGRPV